MVSCAHMRLTPPVMLRVVLAMFVVGGAIEVLKAFVK